MALSSKLDHARLRMPAYYPLCVVVGMAGFAVLLAALIALYCWLIWSGVSPFIHRTLGSGPVTVEGAILRIMLGLMFFLLTWRSLRGSEQWRGVEVASGSCPPLEELVDACAARVGVPAPDAIYLTPDGYIAAFNSGRVRGSGDHRNFVNIGAMVLPGLSRNELEAALFHEFAHLVMRSNQWAVALDNRIRESVPRLRLANRRGGRIFFIAVTTGRVLLLWYWNLYNLLMAPLRRREELMADDFAAALCGNAEYAGHLATILCLQQTFDEELADLINGNFHAELLGMPENPTPKDQPNWFDIAHSCFTTDLVPKLNAALGYLRDVEPQTLMADHPTFRTRLSRLGAAMPASAQEFLTDDPILDTAEDWQRQISAAFAERLRPEFYLAKQRAGFANDHGFVAGSITSYPCRFASCRIFGKTNLLLSQQGLRWVYQDGSIHNIRWSDLASVEVLPNGRPSGKNGPWIMSLMAMYWDLPSLAELEIAWPTDAQGMVSRRNLQIFHLRENMQEAMDLTNALWLRSRSAVTASGRNLPLILRELKSTLTSEAAPDPASIDRQTSLIQEAFRRNAGQQRPAEFAALLQLYESLLQRAANATRWAGSVKGRAIVLDQLNRRQALRARIAGMGFWSFLGRLLWMPIWVRVAAVAGTLTLCSQAVYLLIAWHRETAIRFLPVAGHYFNVTWFRVSFEIGLILLSLSVAARMQGVSVFETIDLTTLRTSVPATESVAVPGP
jgi:Zn-dependent protease with chaperone function